MHIDLQARTDDEQYNGIGSRRKLRQQLNSARNFLYTGGIQRVTAMIARIFAPNDLDSAAHARFPYQHV